MAAAEVIRAAYIYDYMDADHLDSLALVDFNRAVVRLVGDSLGYEQAAGLDSLVSRGSKSGVEVVLDFLLESPERLATLPSARRYTWGGGEVESTMGCPSDTLFWKNALFDRAEEILRAVPGVRKLAVDLEGHSGGRKHYDAGPCRCPQCLAEYTGALLGHYRPRDVWRLSGLTGYQEARLTQLLGSLMREFSRRHPGVEVGVFDLDFDSFVHRALARALAKSGVPTIDYCERTYDSGPGALAGARARLKMLGLGHAPLVGGLWLKRCAPRDLPAIARSIRALADGYFVFTTYSLWREPSRLTGPYTLQGRPAEYWHAIAQANRSL
jgi:hypothetical protein